MNFFRSIMGKILIPVIVMTLSLVAVIVSVSLYSFNRFADKTYNDKVEVATHGVHNDARVRRIMALDQISGLAQSASMIAAFKEGSREKIRDILNSFESEQKCEFFTALDPNGDVFVRPTDFGRFGDSNRMLKGVQDALTHKKPFVYIESTPSTRLAIRAAAPVLDEDDDIIGIVTGGFRLDTNDTVDAMKEAHGVDCTIFLDDERISTTVLKEGTDERAIGTKLNNPAIYDQVFKERKEVIGVAMVQGVQMKVFYSPILNPGDDHVIGMLFVGLPMKEQEDLLRQNRWSSLSITIVGLLIFGIVLFGIVRRIILPMNQGCAILREITEQGRLSTEVPDNVLRRKDEIGELGRDIERVLGDYRTIAETAEQLANRNWDITVKNKGSEDIMNHNFSTMLDQMNKTLHEVGQQVKQVATGSGEVSSAAQALSSGAQESAASLEEITASMNEISGQTKKNAEDAAQARDLARQASTAAGNGQTAMMEMTDAMGRITQNSNEIQRVIKVIDDIAFQTNLLALNAAVEAARAGQHGKGFAVVAEEVRNLASRSAKAAKETSDLIAKSSQEIDRGGKVANHTAEVLTTIVEQIKQTTDLVAGIAVASNEQAQGVNQVSIGLQQIDSVTQQNTAAAEESASAASEMNSMAANLQNLVAQFKLR